MDVAIRAAATANAPRDYTIPGAQELLPKSVSASMDGTAAVSSWLPCLQVLDPSGAVMFSAVSDTAVAAGGTVDVSWFPGLGAGGGGTFSSGLQSVRVNIVGNQSVPEGVNTVVTWGEATIDTGTPSKFWNAGSPTRLTAPVTGAYLSLVNLEWDVIPAVDGPAYVGSYLYKNGAAAFTYDSTQGEPDIGTAFNLTGNHHGIWELTAGDYFELFAFNFNVGAVNRNLIDRRGIENHFASWSLILVSTG